MKRLGRHECGSTGMYNEIYAEDGGEWTLDLDDATSTINFCPYCGLNLPKISEELIQARKAELEEIERNRPPRKPTTQPHIDNMLKEHYAKPMIDYLNGESSISKFLKK